MTDDLLNQDNQDTIDLDKDYYPELLEKFKDNKGLARAKMESDLYIKTLIRQKEELARDNDALRTDVNARASQEELLDRLKRQMQTQDTGTQGDQDTRPALKPEDVDSLLSQKIPSLLEQYEKDRSEKNNFNEVQAKLKDRYGANYTEVLAKQIQDLGLSTEDVNALAKRSPKAFYRTFGLDQQSGETFQSPPRSQRGDNFAPSTNKRTWSYYQNLKKTNPKEWNNPKTQVQMHEDYIQLGKAFEDGDFSAL